MQGRERPRWILIRLRRNNVEGRKPRVARRGRRRCQWRRLQRCQWMRVRCAGRTGTLRKSRGCC
eukprot:2431818-Pleurochrysis_carterae.AAC.1